jgi:hypothetical protein
MDTKKIKNFFESPKSKKYTISVLALIIALCIFQAGVFVGFKKAAFSYKFGDNYYRAFGEGRHGIGMMGSPFGDLSGGHGAVGKIIKITLPTIVVEAPDNTEKVVVLDDDTEIKQFRNSVQADALHVNDFVVVLGSPNDQGQVVARLVRLLPPPPTGGMATSSPTKSY